MTEASYSSGKILSVNLAATMPDPAGSGRNTGICKVSTDSLEVFAPGPNYGDGPGVVGDFVGDSKHHGGADKAVYAYAREELDFWGQQAKQEYANGYFGENLTTLGIDWTAAVINQQIKVGTALLEVSVPRQPCQTFASWLEERGWVKTFSQHGDCGAYLRVIEPGIIRADDYLEFLPAPAHGITMGQAFAAKMGDKEAAAKVYAASCLPKHHHEQLAKLLNL